MSPIIGVSCKIAFDETWCPGVVGAREGYVQAVVEAGGTPLLIPPHVNPQMLRQLYDLTDGILLPGGGDIDPALYGESPHPNLGTIEALRDEIELPLARWTMADRKPLLAICRGMQVLNVALGGTLYQDIPSQYQTDIDHEAGSNSQCWVNTDHSTTLDARSRLATLLEATNVGMNSLHHQALRAVAPGLRVVGRAPDGIIEAVEAEGDAFVIGVQCHPETLWQEVDPRWRRVFRGFIEAAADRA